MAPDYWVELLLLAGAGVSAVVAAVRQGARQAGRPKWLRAGRALGLGHIQVRGRTWFMAGEVGGWSVLAEGVPAGERVKTRLIVRPGAAGRLSGQIAFAAEPKAIGRLVADADRTLGVPDFDDAIRIGAGPWALALALLDHRARARLMACAAEGVVVEGGEIVANLGDPGSVGETLEARLRRMLALAKALDLSESDVPTRLARNARRDPIPEIRAANLTALLNHHRDHPLAASTLRAALEDSDPTVRFEAAHHAGVDAGPALAGIAADDRASGPLRARALARLIDTAPTDWTDALLINHAGPEAPAELRTLVAQHAVRRSLQPALLSLLHDPEGVPDAPLARVAQAAAGLGALAEPSLLALVEQRAGATRLAAIEALGQVGGPAAAGLLRPLTRGLSLSSEVKAAAEAALDALSARLATSPGALSLARGSEAGGLALSEGAARGLAESEDA